MHSIQTPYWGGGGLYRLCQRRCIVSPPCVPLPASVPVAYVEELQYLGTVGFQVTAARGLYREVLGGGGKQKRLQ